MSFIKLIARLCLFLPVLAGMMYFSYTVDPAGLFWGAEYERLVVDYMLEGEYVTGYEKLNGRELNKIYAKKIKDAPDVLITGSSRSMMIDSTFVKDKTLYNACNVGADFYDFFTAYYVFAKEGKEPETIIMGVDPWIFNELFDFRSDKELYQEFIAEELGHTLEGYEKEEKDPEIYKALIEPSYFQSSVKYYFAGASGEVPETIKREDFDLLSRNDVIKCPDGSVRYSPAYENRGMDFVKADAEYISNDGYRMFFSAPKEEHKRLFAEFIEYLQAKGIEIIFYLPPCQPLVYDAFLSDVENRGGPVKAEEFVREVAAEYGVPVYGSYNPEEAGVELENFIDGLHLRQESMKKILSFE